MEWRKQEDKWVCLESPALSPAHVNIAKFVIVMFDNRRMPSEAMNTQQQIEANSLKILRDHSYITYTSIYISLFSFLENLTIRVSRYICMFSVKGKGNFSFSEPPSIYLFVLT